MHGMNSKIVGNLVNPRKLKSLRRTFRFGGWSARVRTATVGRLLLAVLIGSFILCLVVWDARGSRTAISESSWTSDCRLHRLNKTKRGNLKRAPTPDIRTSQWLLASGGLLKVPNSSNICIGKKGNFTVQLGSWYLPTGSEQMLEGVCISEKTNYVFRSDSTWNFLLGCKYPYQVGHLMYNCISHVFFAMYRLGLLGEKIHMRIFTMVDKGTEGYLKSALSTFLESFEVQSLLELKKSREQILTNAIIGVEGSPLDHYNMDQSIAPYWRLFMQHITKPLPPGGIVEKKTINIIIIDRKRDRKLGNALHLKYALESLAFVDKVSLVYLEELNLFEQMSLFRQSNLAIGMDGTGLFNVNFMTGGNRSAVIRIMPYKGDEILPNKSNNFEAIWDALGILHMGLSIRNAGCSRFEGSEADFQTFLRNFTRSPEALSLGSKYSYILRQETNVSLQSMAEHVSSLYERLMQAKSRNHAKQLYSH